MRLIVLALAVLTVGCGQRQPSAYTSPTIKVQADLSAAITSAEKEELMGRVIKLIEKRIGGMASAKTFKLNRTAPDTVSVSVEGPTLDQVREVVLNPGSSVQFYWARNLNTDKVTSRPYSVFATDKPTEVAFTNNSDGKKIEPPSKGSSIVSSDYKKVIDGWNLILAGSDIESATPTNENGKWMPAIRFTKLGGQKMRAWCMAHHRTGENLAFVFDGVAVSVLPLSLGAIIERDAVISGDFEPTYVRDMVKRINDAAMPAKLTEVK